jgi:phage gpG-like protein
MAKIKWKAHPESAKNATRLMIRSAQGSGREAVAAFTATVMQRDSKQAFIRKKDPTTGESWVRRRRQYKWPILRKSGTYWADIYGDYSLSRSGFRSFVKIQSGSPAEEYGQIHQRGGSISRSLGSRSGASTFFVMPARPAAGITPKGRKIATAFAKARLLGGRR